MKLYLLSIQRFAIIYIIVSLLLLTLNPFKFQPFNYTNWIVYFSLVDGLQNIFLFIPLGIILRHTLRQVNLILLIYGTCLSLGIELLQTGIAERSSNPIDVFFNTIGTFIGILYHNLLPRNTQQNNTILLAFLVIPIGWVTAMRAATDVFSDWLVIPTALVGALALKNVFNHKSMPNLVLIAAWIILITLPLLSINQIAGALTISLTMLTFYLNNYLDNHKIIVRVLSSIGLLGILLAAINWLYQHFPLVWNVATHLCWIEVLLMTGVQTLVWQRSVISDQ
jgi:hypothetical protein